MYLILFIKKHQQVWKFKIEWISPVLTLRKVKETIIRKILLSVFSFRLKLALKLRTFTNFSRAEFFLDFWSAVICYTVRQVCSVCLLDITIDQNQLEKWVNILSFIFPWTRYLSTLNKYICWRSFVAGKKSRCLIRKQWGLNQATKGDDLFLT